MQITVMTSEKLEWWTIREDPLYVIRIIDCQDTLSYTPSDQLNGLTTTVKLSPYSTMLTSVGYLTEFNSSDVCRVLYILIF